jgi:outer membrane protein OmpA-like peptidoglycan-associated protein
MELVHAREAYSRAKRSLAHDLASVDLREARRSLDAAERSYRDDGRGPETSALAYVAERRAQIALVSAYIAMNATTIETARELEGEPKEPATGSDASETNVTAERSRLRSESEVSAALEGLRWVATVRDEGRGMVITLSGGILFAPGASTLLPTAAQRLDPVVRALSDHSTQTLLVEGHMDSRGSARRSETLSLERALAVRAYLVTKGVAPDMIRAVGMGARRPAAGNDDARGRASNRRVEIVVEPERSGPVTRR